MWYTKLFQKLQNFISDKKDDQKLKTACSDVDNNTSFETPSRFPVFTHTCCTLLDALPTYCISWKQHQETRGAH
jgi:hypothetical protein